MRREAERMTQKQEEVAARRKLEESIREQEAREKAAKEQKRLKLREITESDRLAKDEFAGTMKQKLNEFNQNLPKNDIMAKVFEERTHQAFQRRAKNDRIVEVIGSRFMGQNDDEERARKAAEYTKERQDRENEM